MLCYWNKAEVTPFPILINLSQQILQNLVRDLSSIATRCTVNGLNICGKKVCVFICLKKSDKPAAYILSVHPTGSGLSVESGVFRGENTDCMFDCPDILGGKAKIILIKSREKLNLFHRGDP